jgi:hypothetical protein
VKPFLSSLVLFFWTAPLFAMAMLEVPIETCDSISAQNPLLDLSGENMMRPTTSLRPEQNLASCNDNDCQKATATEEFDSPTSDSSCSN